MRRTGAWDGSGLVMLWKRLERRIQVAAGDRRRDEAELGAAGGADRRHGLVAAARAAGRATERDILGATE